MASNSSSCPTPGGGHLNGYPVPPYAFFFPPMLGGLSPPGALTTLQHQLPVSGYSTPSPANNDTSRVSHSHAVPELHNVTPGTPGTALTLGHTHPRPSPPAATLRVSGGAARPGRGLASG
ncbi:hypothetical protein E2I00_013909 [Balaenoptera physalus]|uniref:Uncharacterized protein n=1 Tax=Balaenoptera physalus TaxID=9770 RepID=A0A643CEK9_BALPH|nr:hypothetical protein E2I00_013909 [Balaenoptera physalus]